MAKRKVNIPKSESKHDRFKRVVTPRVQRAIKAIQVVGYCSGAAYTYTEKDLADIMEALQGAVGKVGESYAQGGGAVSSFSLD